MASLRSAKALAKLGRSGRSYRRYAALEPLNELHTVAGRLSLDSENTDTPQKRAQFHTTPVPDRAAAIMLSLGAVSATAYAASSAVKAYNEYVASLPDEPIEEAKKEDETTAKAEDVGSKKESKEKEGKRENIFKKWFGTEVGSKYYEGGFEDTMTRREAALILGVRESSSVARIKEAHRKLLVLNHPDTGGSTFIAGKINEAKELLLKGKSK